MKRILGWLAVATVALTGCYDDADPYYYDYAYYDPYYYWYDASYAYSWYDPYGVYYFAATGQTQASTIDLTAAASSIATRAAAYYTPSGCVTATPAGASVTFVYDGCTTAFDRRTVSGTVVLNLAQENEQLRFTANSSDLVVGGRPLILELSAAATAAGTQRAVTLESKTRHPDATDSRQTLGTLTWEQGSDCITINAQGSSTRGELTSRSTISNLQRCGTQCPSAGTVTVDSPDGVLTANFAGEGDVRVQGPNGGDERVFDLQCD